MEGGSVLQVYYQSGLGISQHRDPTLLEISFNEFQCSPISWHLQLHPVHISDLEREDDFSSWLPWEIPWLPLISFASDLILRTKEGGRHMEQGAVIRPATSWSLVTLLYFILPTFSRGTGLQNKVWCVLAGLGRWMKLSYSVLFLPAAPCHKL